MIEGRHGTALDLDLIHRYGVHGPRYTSYPTALQFDDRFDEGTYRRAAENSNRSRRPLSLYVHIPYCRSLCYYCACTKIVSQHPERVVPYLADVLLEAEMTSEYFGIDRVVTQLHLGGGTPTFCTDDELKTLMSGLRSRFQFSKDCECSIEIDPRTVDSLRIKNLAGMGFNRASMGVQDFDATVQNSINRIQSAERTLELIQASRQHGFKSVSVDLIYGLPRQTVERFDRTLDSVIDAAPDRISLYSYAHMPDRFKAQRLIDGSELPSGHEKIDLLVGSIRKLTASGYDYIGMDHFAREDDELAGARKDGGLHRNFQGYSTQAECDLLGFGISAISHFGGCFSQNVKKTADYSAALKDRRLPIERGLVLDHDDKLRAAVIQRIMCNNRVEFAEISDRFGIVFRDYFATEIETLADLERDGLVDIDDDAISVTPAGRLLLRVVAMPFDRYLQTSGTTQKFSKVI